MPQINDIKVGDKLPGREYRPDNVQLFLYNAVLWNAHRIHYDDPYAREAEGYPGLVVAGPLMGDWLTQCVLEWLGEAGELVSVEYSNRRAAYAGELLHSGGEVLAVEPENGLVEIGVFVKSEAGQDIIPGTIVARLSG
jgi:hydroxyacyl-ACP dehydratase HTD2-like protein with hotdog domain